MTTWREREAERRSWEHRKQERRNNLIALTLMLILWLIPMWVIAYIFAPCGYLDWLPHTQTPGRCL